MSLKFFKKILANVCIVLVISLVSLAAFMMPAGVVVTGVAPVYKADGGNKVSLMVNVYWGDEYLDDMLKTFDKHNIKTTFFVGGCWAAKNEQKLIEIYGKGHEIANHGYFHKDHKKLNAARNKEEISACHNLIKNLIGVEMKLFSPPGASFSEITLEVAQKSGYTTVMYSRDTIDWRDKSADIVYERATKNTKPGELILMHPTQHTLQALEKIVQYYKENNIKLITVGENIKGI